MRPNSAYVYKLHEKQPPEGCISVFPAGRCPLEGQRSAGYQRMNANNFEHHPLGARRALPDELATIIISRIEAGEYKLGDVLPSEKAMADMYQVSRTVVREALARLKYEGVIRSKRGSGPVISGTVPLKGFELHLNMENKESLTEYYEFRLILEGEAAALAAVRHTPEDAALFRSYLDQMSRAIEESTSGADPDFRFHQLIADSSRNGYVRNLTKNLSAKLWIRVYNARGLSNQVRERAQLVLEEHNAIFEAIASRDPQSARAAVQRHIYCSSVRQGLAVNTRFLTWDVSDVRCS